MVKVVILVDVPNPDDVEDFKTQAAEFYENCPISLKNFQVGTMLDVLEDVPEKETPEEPEQ
jgi:hypothetical protein